MSEEEIVSRLKEMSEARAGEMAPYWWGDMSEIRSLANSILKLLNEEMEE